MMVAAASFLAAGAIVAWLGLVVRWVSQARQGTGGLRPRMHWAAAGGLAAMLVVCSGLMLDVLVGWPPNLSFTILAAATTLMLGLVAASISRARAWAERALAHTIVAGGLLVLIEAIYVATVIGWAGAPQGQERTVLVLSIAAAAVAVTGEIGGDNEVLLHELWSDE